MNQKLKFLREKLSLSEKDISSLLNISSYKYASFEREGVVIPCDTLLLISKIYGININSLIYDTFDKESLSFELNQKGLFDTTSKTTIQKLKCNLFSTNNPKTTYRSIRNVKFEFQNNIIDFINNLISTRSISFEELCLFCEIEQITMTSILSKKRFISTFELIKISKFSQTSIDRIIYYHQN